MKKTQLLSAFLILFLLSCNGQEKRIELNPECLSYIENLAQDTAQNEDIINIECAKTINNGGDFILNLEENIRITFSTKKSGKLDREMLLVRDVDTLLKANFDNGKLLHITRFTKNGTVDNIQQLKDSVYHVSYPSLVENWIIDNQLAFKSQSINLIKNLDNELLKISYLDSLNVTRFVTDYKLNSSFLYNPKGVLIQETKNRLIEPRYEDFAPNGQSILVSLSPNAFSLKPYPYIDNINKEHNALFYNDNGDLIQENNYNIDDQYGINTEITYYNSGKIRRKEILHLTGGIKTRTYDVNNKLIKETIEIVMEPEVQFIDDEDDEEIEIIEPED